MNEPQDQLPQDGLYVTTQALPGHEDKVPADTLVHLRHQPTRQLWTLTLPRAAEYHRWIFHEHGFDLDDMTYLLSLKPRPSEGFYILTQGVLLSEERSLETNALVQLSYTVKGMPIIYSSFFENNAIRFADAGYKFAEDILLLLKPAGFEVGIAAPQEERPLH